MSESDDISIEPLLERDIPELAALAKKVWLNTFTAGLTEADIAEALTSRNQLYFETAFGTQTICVAKSGGQLCGFIEYGNDGLSGMSIDKLYVDPNYEGRGIGRQLMKWALDDPELIGRQVMLDVWIENKKAIALYESLDFKVIGERAFSSSSGEVLTPDLIMQRAAEGKA